MKSDSDHDTASLIPDFSPSGEGLSKLCNTFCREREREQKKISILYRFVRRKIRNTHNFIHEETEE